MTDSVTEETLLKTKINGETASINWVELQPYFAKGRLIYVDQTLDLIDVAYQFSQDNKLMVEIWLKEGQINRVSDEQAKQFVANEQNFWASVISPWVLIQPCAAPTS